MEDLIVDVGVQVAQRLYLQADGVDTEAAEAERERQEAHREFLASNETDVAKRAAAQRRLQSLAKKAQQLRRAADAARAAARRAHLASTADPEVTAADLQAVRRVPVSKADAEERAAVAAEFAWATVRAERNALLAGSDWTQLSDVPTVKRERWAKYRQELRDLPAVTKDPARPDWPKSP